MSKLQELKGQAEGNLKIAKMLDSTVIMSVSPSYVLKLIAFVEAWDSLVELDNSKKYSAKEKLMMASDIGQTVYLARKELGEL